MNDDECTRESWHRASPFESLLRLDHDELQAFTDLPPLPDRVTERLCRLVLLGILPAVVERDLLAFGAALDELQARIGAAFAPVQGSIYASARSEGLIADLGRPGRSPGMCQRGRT